MISTTTSTSLLEGLKDPGNEAVWRQYVERYRPLIVRFAVRMGVHQEDAEDVAQETLLDFSEAYRKGRYARDRGRLRTWLFGIAFKEVSAWRTRRGAAHAITPSAAEEILLQTETPGDPEEVWNKEWRDAILDGCLREIRKEIQPRTFEAFELFALKEWPARKVADELGITENAVFLAKSRVLKRVREIMPVMEDVW